MSESRIESRFVEHAKKRGAAAYKFTSPNRRSVPDRLVLAPGGVMFFIEFKAPGQEPTPAQYREHEKLRTLGFEVYVIDTPGDGEVLLNMKMDGLL
jgi:hypothetical protein